MIVNRLREYRIKASISQLALAKSVGVARQTINLIENNKYNPSLDLCIRLAECLQTDLNTLFGIVDIYNRLDSLNL
ncbi:helix-turn-helix transcriptional regulator [Streptococcus agalactiae]|nr:helix-turn-helix transcriptional regulator [Streptococcus agalactiae]